MEKIVSAEVDIIFGLLKGILQDTCTLLYVAVWVPHTPLSSNSDQQEQEKSYQYQ